MLRKKIIEHLNNTPKTKTAQSRSYAGHYRWHNKCHLTTCVGINGPDGTYLDLHRHNLTQCTLEHSDKAHNLIHNSYSQLCRLEELDEVRCKPSHGWCKRLHWPVLSDIYLRQRSEYYDEENGLYIRGKWFEKPSQHRLEEAMGKSAVTPTVMVNKSSPVDMNWAVDCSFNSDTFVVRGKTVLSLLQTRGWEGKKESPPSHSKHT